MAGRKTHRAFTDDELKNMSVEQIFQEITILAPREQDAIEKKQRKRELEIGGIISSLLRESIKRDRNEVITYLEAYSRDENPAIRSLAGVWLACYEYDPMYVKNIYDGLIDKGYPENIDFWAYRNRRRFLEEHPELK